MSATPSVLLPRQAAVLATILGLHASVLLLVAAGLRWVPIRVADPDRSIIVVPLPPPAPPEATRPKPVGAPSYEPERIAPPELDIPKFEKAFQPSDDSSHRSAAQAGEGPGLPAAGDRGPRLEMRDAALQAVIDACYPASARRRGQEGRGEATLVVDAEGRVVRWRLEDGTGFASLDAAIGCVARRLEFEPARHGGHAIESMARLPVVFRLD
jgi:protein TonB